MPQITRIEPQKNKHSLISRKLENKKRFNIFIDGEFALGLDAEILIKEGLKENQEISSERINELVKENELQKLLDKALRFLSYRPRSEKEISDFLTRKQAGKETVKMVMVRLKDLGMIDDLKFSQWWLEQRQTFRPKGKRLLVMELKGKGVNREIIDRLLESQTGEDEFEIGKRILAKKAERWQNLSPLEFRKKASEFLLRRGFSWDTIKRILDNRDFDGEGL